MKASPRSAAERARGGRAPRRGAAMVLFALLVFALLAVATLSVDLGLAHLTQAQMQDATDSAALEGQRWRQYSEELLLGLVADPLRRAKANEMIELVFDDDLDPRADSAGFGAGPVFERVATLDGFGGVLELPDEPVWKPSLLPNFPANAASGDLVAGTLELDAPALEGPDYERADFSALSGPAGWRSDAFLARLRRTGRPAPEDDEAGESSHGPGLPLLFGHGAAIRADSGGDAAGWDPRRDGLTLRSTSIAYTRPAFAVGERPRATDGSPIRQTTAPPASWDSPIDPLVLAGLAHYDHLGVAPFVVSLQYWERHTTNSPACVVARVEPDALGRPLRVLRAWDASAQALGEIVGWFDAGVRQLGRAAVGTPITDAAAVLPPRIDGYVPIVEEIEPPDGSPPVWRVIGFGHGVLWDPTVANQETNCFSDSAEHLMRTVSKFRTRVPATGVHAGFVEPADPLSLEEWSRIFALNRQHFTTDLENASILAPALAR